jgi:hypothetical protein
MLGEDFREQINGRIGIDRLVKPGRGRQRFDVEGPIDIRTLPATIGLEFFFPSLFDPAV